MLRSLVLGSLLSCGLVVFAACGGAIDTSSVDAGAASTSSSSGGSVPGSSSGSSSSGFYPPRDGGVHIVDGGKGVTPGLIACPSAFDTCISESGPGTAKVCCVRGPGYACEDDGRDCADGDVLRCDEGSDCTSGVCCAEETTGGTSATYTMATRCQSTCVTNYPREKVCTVDSECDTKTCRDWSCARFDMRGIKTCGPIGPCL